MTITEFLLARVAEDEGVADRVEFRPYLGDGVPQSLTDRVLTECEAKRRIIELADEATGLDMQVDSEFAVGQRNEIADPYIGNVMLRVLASVYADHPDFRDEWRL